MASETILIVDDENSYRMMLRGLLEKKGFQVIEAANGEEGIAKARDYLPALILLDVNMPKCNGPEAVALLKASEKTVQLPIIMVSAREDSDDLLKCFANGASDYVRKVFQHEELLARINTHLAISRLRRELMEANNSLRLANKTLRNDLNYAGEIQRSILAQVLPEVDNLEFAGRYFSCSETSGDHYSVFWLDENNIGICIADASGHGVGAAMLAVFLKGQLENISRVDGRARGPLRPVSEVAKMINDSLCAKNFGQEFISAIYGILTLSTMEFTFVNAGHPYPILLDTEGSVHEIQTSNPILGIFEQQEFEDYSLKLQSGQAIFMYTDGIVDTANAKREQYGIERLMHNLGMVIGNHASTVADRIIKSMDEFRGENKAEDDVSLLMLRREIDS